MIAKTPYEQFKINKEAAATYSRSYVELRKLKELGTRGALSEENRYLLWLPRAGVVGAIAALDHYIHQVLYEKIPERLSGTPAGLSDPLCDLIVRGAIEEHPKCSRRDPLYPVFNGTGRSRFRNP